MIVAYRHLAAKTLIIGIYTDMNRAKRAAEQQGYKHNKVKYEGFEVNDGISELQNINNEKEIFHGRGEKVSKKDFGEKVETKKT